MPRTSNTRARVILFLEIFLRVPPLYSIDIILQKIYPYEYAHPLHNTKFGSMEFDENVTDAVARKYLQISSISFDLQTLMQLGISMLGLILASIIFLLSREHLISTYRWLLAVFIVFLSHINNDYYQNSVPTSIYEQTTMFILHSLAHVVLAVTFSLAHSQYENEIVFIFSSFLLPTLLSLFPVLPEPTSEKLPQISTIICSVYISFCLIRKIPRVIQELNVKLHIWKMYIRYYGFSALLENEWLRINVPDVLRLFWMFRVAYDSAVILTDTSMANELDKLPAVDAMYLFSKEILTRGCNTALSMVGMTSVVSSLSHLFGVAVQHFLMTDDEDDKSIGTVTAVLFFVLALQTGLMNLEPEKRIVRLYRNFCLLFTAILHFIHNIVNPLLMSLSASRNRSTQRHVRVLTVCFLLLALPSWFLQYLWTNHTISTWMLAVSAFTIEVIIKVLISLLLYSLFMIDAYQNAFWEKLDDYVYYIRATGNTIEFFFGIFLFFNGAWILMFEAGGAIRACMMCIHAYINIWMQAKAGWRIFIKRRTAVNKINALPEATQEQLQSFDDVCAICYQELTNARITKCNHYFHGVCLRKWLYVQDRCPLCHNTLYRIDSDTEDFAQEIPQQEVAGAAEERDTDEDGDVVRPIHEHQN